MILEGKPDGLRWFALECLTSPPAPESPSAPQPSGCGRQFLLGVSATNLGSDGGRCVGSFDRATDGCKKQMSLLQKVGLAPGWSLSLWSPLPSSSKSLCGRRAAAEIICREIK